MAETHTQPFKITENLPDGVPANFGLRLDAFDATGKSYRGDLTFINWESTVGTRCNQFWAAQGPASFAFMSDPQNMVELHKRQFNLIGLANNHTRDCPDAEEGVDGAHASARHMTQLSQETGANWLWHGVGTEKTAAVKTLTLKGKPIKVAFASLYIAEGDCTYVTCAKDQLTVLRSLRDADANLRILAMHSWTDDTQTQLVDIGVNFIRNYDGDIVFGHGPHVWEPVRVVESARGNGKRGIIFESLGNFIHPALVPSSQHLIGRALYDLDTLKLRQVQIIPITLNRIYASFGGASALGLPANLTWQEVRDPIWQSGVSPNISAAYTNIKQ
jgi:poly-gamma-glutamate synthesis protein (capsule biosynthesis protein)